MLEKEVAKKIKEVLGVWEATGEVEWWERLQSGKVRIEGRYVQMCQKGTPDFIALIRNKYYGITVVFIEAKSDIGQLRIEQQEFKDKHGGKKDIFVLKISNPKDLDKFINDTAFDCTENINLGELICPTPSNPSTTTPVQKEH